MPKILASLPAETKLSLRPSTPDAGNLASLARGKSDRAASFQEALTGARRRDPAPESKSADVERAEKSKPKPKIKAKDKSDKPAARESTPSQAEGEISSEESAESRETSLTESKKAKKSDEKKTDSAETTGEADVEVEAVEGEGETVVAQPTLPELELPVSDELPVEEAVNPDAGNEAESDESLSAAAMLALAHDANVATPVGTPEVMEDDSELLDAVGSIPTTVAPADSQQAGKSVDAKAMTPESMTAGIELPEDILPEDATVPQTPELEKPAADVEFADLMELAADKLSSAEPHSAKTHLSDSATKALESFAAPEQPKPAQTSNVHANLPQPAMTPEARFAEDNVPKIVTGVSGQLLPTGGTMQIKLDPPELGPLAVTVRIHDGVMEASFETSNDQAAKLLSHSLSNLKTSLESQGVNVERLQVHQAPKEQATGQGGNERESQQGSQGDPTQEHAARQEQQRKEMIRRMWAKLTGNQDPLDMVA